MLLLAAVAASPGPRPEAAGGGRGGGPKKSRMIGCVSILEVGGRVGGAAGIVLAALDAADELVIRLLSDTVLSTSMHSTLTVVVVGSTQFFPRTGDFSLSDLMSAAVTLTLWVTKVSVKLAVVKPFFSPSSLTTAKAGPPPLDGLSVPCFSDLLLRLLGTGTLVVRTASLPPPPPPGSLLSFVRFTSLEPAPPPPPLLMLFSRSVSSFLA